MNRHIRLITLILLSGCFQNRQADSSGQITNADSVAITTLGQQEQAAWDYFQQIETAIKDEKEIHEERIDNYIQALIDKGSIPKPAIFIDTERGLSLRLLTTRLIKNSGKPIKLT